VLRYHYSPFVVYAIAVSLCFSLAIGAFEIAGGPVFKYPLFVCPLPYPNNPFGTRDIKNFPYRGIFLPTIVPADEVCDATKAE
jgi:hypothetical protein